MPDTIEVNFRDGDTIPVVSSSGGRLFFAVAGLHFRDADLVRSQPARVGLFIDTDSPDPPGYLVAIGNLFRHPEDLDARGGAKDQPLFSAWFDVTNVPFVDADDHPRLYMIAFESAASPSGSRDPEANIKTPVRKLTLAKVAATADVEMERVIVTAPTSGNVPPGSIIAYGSFAAPDTRLIRAHIVNSSGTIIETDSNPYSNPMGYWAASFYHNTNASNVRIYAIGDASTDSGASFNIQ